MAKMAQIHAEQIGALQTALDKFYEEYGTTTVNETATYNPIAILEDLGYSAAELTDSDLSYTLGGN
jgi:hypothetical protein